MRRIFESRLITFAVLIFAMTICFVGCSNDDNDYDAMTDGSSWNIVQTYEMKVPGAVWPFSEGEVLVGADDEHLYFSTDGGGGWSTTILDNTTERSVLDILFTSSRGIIIGERGMIYTSTDDGATWDDASIAGLVEDERNLRDIIYPATGETDPLFIVGQSGTLLRSVDGGASWSELMLDIVMAESTMVIDSGDTTWDHTPVYVNQEIIDFTGGYAPSASVVYAVGDTLSIDDEYYLYYSTDAGDNWDILTVPLGGEFPECYFSDDTTGMVFGSNGTIYRVATANDTVVMSFVVINLGSGGNLKEVEFITSEIGWTVGAGGMVAKTIDGGENWNVIDVDITGAITDIGFINTNEGWIVGNDLSRGTGAIKVTTDGGANWFFRSYGLGLALNAVHFVDASEGWIAGKSGRIAHTTDGGRMWLHQDANMDKTFQDIFFLNENCGWAVGFSTNDFLDTTMTILYTTDGGGEWTTLDSLSGQRLDKVVFSDANNGWAVGNSGLILRSENGGVTWTNQDAGVVAELFDIDMRSATEAFVVGQYGTILRTTDGGSNWAALTSGTTQSLMGIDMVSSQVGYACGSMGTIIKTTDGGNSWVALELPSYSGSVFKSISFINSEVGWVVGKFGYIMHTVDGGETWYRQEAGFSEETLNEVFILDANHAWIAGDASILMELNP